MYAFTVVNGDLGEKVTAQGVRIFNADSKDEAEKMIHAVIAASYPTSGGWHDPRLIGSEVTVEELLQLTRGEVTTL